MIFVYIFFGFWFWCAAVDCCIAWLIYKQSPTTVDRLLLRMCVGSLLGPVALLLDIVCMSDPEE